MKRLAAVLALVLVLAVPALAQEEVRSSRSVQVRVSPGCYEAVVDGTTHRFDSAEALDRFLRAQGLGSARLGARGDGPGLRLPELRLPALGDPATPGTASRSVRVEVRPGVFRAVVDGVAHEFPTAEALDAFLKKHGLGSASFRQSSSGPVPAPRPKAEPGEDDESM